MSWIRQIFTKQPPQERYEVTFRLSLPTGMSGRISTRPIKLKVYATSPEMAEELVLDFVRKRLELPVSEVKQI